MFKKIILSIALLLSTVLVGPVGADSGIEIGIKRSAFSDYNQSQLKLPGDINLSSIGGRFYLSAPPVIDLIIEIDNRTDLVKMIPGGYDVDLKIRDYSISLSAVLPLKISSITAFFGGGISSHSIAYQYRQPALLSLSDYGIEIPESSTYPGYNAVAGLNFKPTGWSVGLFVEAQSLTINSPGDNINYFEIGGGISFVLPE